MITIVILIKMITMLTIINLIIMTLMVKVIKMSQLEGAKELLLPPSIKVWSVWSCNDDNVNDDHGDDEYAAALSRFGKDRNDDKQESQVDQGGKDLLLPATRGLWSSLEDFKLQVNKIIRLMTLMSDDVDHDHHTDDDDDGDWDSVWRWKP